MSTTAVPIAVPVPPPPAPARGPAAAAIPPLPEEPSVSVSGLVVEYPTGAGVVRAVDGLSMAVGRGELALLIGPSGSGKTSVLSCLGAIQTSAGGAIAVEGVRVDQLTGVHRVRFRRDTVGFVFQSFNLLPALSALDNVAVPLLLRGSGRRRARDRAAELLAFVGLEEQLDRRPSQLSGGQQQRVAVARGLAADPPVLLADEPTANLDHVQATGVVALLRSVADSGRTVVVSTHDARLIPAADRIVDLAADVERDVLAGAEVVLMPGEVLWEQGDRADHIYLVESGEVVLRQRRGDVVRERVVTAGQYLGDAELLLGVPRGSGAVARTAAVVRSVDLPDYRRDLGVGR
jgi:putative ABC transport system ATP-binding protein